MTVGLTLSNGLEAIVITDKRVSDGRRQSDVANKAGVLNADNYNCVLFGSGNGSYVFDLIDGIGTYNAGNFDELFSELSRTHQSSFLKNMGQMVQTWREQANVRVQVEQDERKRDALFDQMKSQIMQQYDKLIQDPQHTTTFLLVGYDAEKRKIRTYFISHNGSAEINMPNYQIGSGADGAGMYFSEELQGIDLKRLSPENLLHHALNAYSVSTINQGVGGTPCIVHVSHDGAVSLPRERAVALANLVGAYRAGMPNVDEAIVDESLAGAFNGKLDIGKIGSKLAMGNVGLVYVPFSSWKEAANTLNYAERIGDPK